MAAVVGVSCLSPPDEIRRHADLIRSPQNVLCLWTGLVLAQLTQKLAADSNTSPRDSLSCFVLYGAKPLVVLPGKALTGSHHLRSIFADGKRAIWRRSKCAESYAATKDLTSLGKLQGNCGVFRGRASCLYPRKASDQRSGYR